MTSYDKIWDYAEDHYGLITNAQAGALGVDKHALPAMAQRGTLIKIGHGVYVAKHHIPRENDVYAHSVAIAGETAYLRGSSVVALLRLAPTNPAIVYLGASGRVRRRLPPNIHLEDMRPCTCVEYEGIRSQPIREALQTALHGGEMEADRVAAAARKALADGLLTESEAYEFKSRPRTGHRSLCRKRYHSRKRTCRCVCECDRCPNGRGRRGEGRHFAQVPI